MFTAILPQKKCSWLFSISKCCIGKMHFELSITVNFIDLRDVDRMRTPFLLCPLGLVDSFSASMFKIIMKEQNALMIFGGKPNAPYSATFLHDSIGIFRNHYHIGNLKSLGNKSQGVFRAANCIQL